MTHSGKTLENFKKVLSGKKEEERGEVPPAEGAGAGASGAQASGQAKFEERLKAVEEEAQKNYDKLLRLAAEFENYKKRSAKELEERTRFSHESLFKELIPVLDDFDRILDHLPESESEEVKSLAEGVRLTHRHFLKALKKFHLEEVGAQGLPFDPHSHEAIAEVESEEQEPGRVVSAHRKGYRLHGRLLRPATVTVAKAPSAEAKEKNEED